MADVYSIRYTFGEITMAVPHLATDIQPLAEFRAKLASVVRRLQRTRRPVVLTQHGRSAAVLVDVREYDALLERLALLQDIQTAERQLARNRGVPHKRAREAVLARVR
jgi:prevent-host-death family protein